MSDGPYYVLPSETVQEALERARDGQDIAEVMTWLYETSDGKARVGELPPMCAGFPGSPTPAQLRLADKLDFFETFSHDDIKRLLLGAADEIERLRTEVGRLVSTREEPTNVNATQTFQDAEGRCFINGAEVPQPAYNFYEWVVRAETAENALRDAHMSLVILCQAKGLSREAREAARVIRKNITAALPPVPAEGD